MSQQTEVLRTSFDELLSPEPKSSVMGGAFDPFAEELGEKTQWKERNDRQLRLWGVHGQARIDNAKVCLLNATAVGAETLKNIVLPGFGKFTIVDNKKVAPRDLGVNFFVSADALGKSRALNVCQHIAELNEENVTGEYLEKDPAEVVEKNPDFFDNFDYIIASQMEFSTLMKLAKICQQKEKVLVVVRSYGLAGYVRIYTPVHEVHETKPDQPIVDLRLANPWPELLKFCDIQDFEKMNNTEYIHTPYPVILLKLMQQWRKEHNDNFPSTHEEKNSFIELIKKYRDTEKRTPKEIEEDSATGNVPEKSNFGDAIKNYYQAYQDAEIPQTVANVFSDPHISNLTKNSSDFWFIAHGLKKFVENEGKGSLPLQGRLPDLESDTTRYTKMQGIYRRKARQDKDIVQKYVQEALKSVGLDENKIDDKDLTDMCANSFFISAVKYRTLEAEHNVNTLNKDAISMCFLEDPNSSVIFYLGLKAVDRFHAKHGKYPGEDGKPDISKESAELKEIFDEILKELEITEPTFDVAAYATELTRYGNAELHNISSLIGGVAGQELIKLCTRQRYPLQNTWIFNGINCTSTTFEA